MHKNIAEGEIVFDRLLSAGRRLGVHDPVKRPIVKGAEVAKGQGCAPFAMRPIEEIYASSREAAANLRQVLAAA